MRSRSVRPRPRAQMAPGDVHIRYCLTESLGEDVIAAAAALLSNEERARRDAFRFDRDRREYTAAHALLRATLSEFGDAAPDAWRFDAGAHGKPAIAAGVSSSPLSFNLAHTLGLVACVVAKGAEVGLDVERVTRSTNWRGVAGRYFSALEVAQIEGVADSRRAARFFELWTLKEAFAKAIGVGLSQPLSATTFEIEPDGAVSFTPPAGILPAVWQFALYTPSPDHRLAVAVGDAAARRWDLHLRASGEADLWYAGGDMPANGR